MTTARPSVSVVIPVYNGAPYIEAAVRSVLEQSAPPLECIVVDDGSTDATLDVLAGFGAAIQVVRQANGGVSSARNTGLSVAKGDYVALLDADDVWLPEKLERQVDAAVRRPDAGLLYTGYWIVDEDLRRRSAILPTPWSERIIGCIHQEGFGIAFACTAMLSRAAIDVVGPFDERLSASADLDYMWRVDARFPVVGVGGALALYRQHGRSQMHQDLDAVETNMDVIIGTFAAGGRASGTRARANVQSFLAVHRLRRGDLRGAWHHGVAGWRAAPVRFVRRPFTVVWRHAQLRLLGRWPYRCPSDPSVLE